MWLGQDVVNNGLVAGPGVGERMLTREVETTWASTEKEISSVTPKLLMAQADVKGTPLRIESWRLSHSTSTELEFIYS